MPKPEWRDPAKEKHWRRMLRMWRRSRLTGRGFCAANGLSEPSFYAWKQEIARRDQEAIVRARARTQRTAKRRAVDVKLPAFMPVRIAGAAEAASVIEVVVAKGRLLRVRPGFDAATLRELVRLLEEPAC
jgi:hypothetical protein